MFVRRQRKICKTRTRERNIRLFVEPLEDRVLLSLLGLAQEGAKPDITSGVNNTLSYTQQGNNANPFSYSSVPLYITLPDGSIDNITNLNSGGNASTNLSAILSNQGYLEPGAAGNSFNIMGHVTIGSNTYDGTLLTATPQAFGFGDSFSPSQGEFEVKMQITGGLLASPSNTAPNPFRVGDELAALIHQPGLPITNFPQSFSFSTNQTGVYDGSSDTLSLPSVPPSMAPGTPCG